jgi:hypothetical protein
MRPTGKTSPAFLEFLLAGFLVVDFSLEGGMVWHISAGTN